MDTCAHPDDSSAVCREYVDQNYWSTEHEHDPDLALAIQHGHDLTLAIQHGHDLTLAIQHSLAEGNNRWSAENGYFRGWVLSRWLAHAKICYVCSMEGCSELPSVGTRK